VPDKQSRLAALDLLRFIAALSVMAFHYCIAFASVWGTRPATLLPAMARVAPLGILGVELFFVISGFVILMSVWGRGLRQFAVSRFVRLYPAYWLSLAAVALLYGLTDVKALDPKLSPGDYLINATMAQRAFPGAYDAVGVYWSLWAELRFYLLMAIFLLAGLTLRRCQVFMVVWLAAAALTYGTTNRWLDMIVMPQYAPYFVAGMAFFLIHRHRDRFAWILALAALPLAIRESVDKVGRRVKLVGHDAMPVGDTAVVIAVIVIFALVALVAVGALGWLRWRGLVLLGGLTYPLYLLHSTVAAALIPVLRDSLPPWAVVTVTAFTAIVIAFLVYRLVERPLQRALRPRLEGLLGVRRGRRAAKDPQANNADSAVTVW
jgi:peptidoglycan/LPS O-acetylase OafA/YrhL